MKRKMTGQVIVMVALLWLQAVTAIGQAQGDRIQISGTIEDQTGAAISGARLSLLAQGTGAERKAVADAAGMFSFDGVPPGAYTLRCEATSFVTAVKEVIARPGAPVNVTLKLQTGAVEEAISVSGSGRDEEESISIERNAGRLNFDDNLLSSLPTPGENPLQLVTAFLSPATQGSEGVSVSVDGMEAGGVDLPARSVRRLRLNRNPYSAEFRRPGKARVEALTDESSFRRYHGSFGYYARNAVFDARNVFALTRPDLNRRLFELTLSGPVIGKRLAFFASGERLLNDESAVVNARLLSGPFKTSVLTPERRTSLLARLDWRATDKQTFVLLYNFRDESELSRGIGGLKLPEQGIAASEKRRRFQLSDRMVLSSHWLNDVRLVIERETDGVGRRVTGPAIVVIGAFTGGQPQSFSANRETTVRVQDNVSYTRGRHALKFGAESRSRRVSATEGSNFGGTFEFSSLGDFAVARPFVFRISQGTPEVSFTQHETTLFMQDEIRLRPNLMLTPGLRYGWQSNLKDRNNLAPRLAVAWGLPDRRTVIRGGAGMFYERIPESVTQRSLLFDGARIRELVITGPAYPDPFGSGQTALPPSAVVQRAANLRAPYLVQASASLEREVWRNAQLSVEYQTLRGVRLLRSRNLNAPLPGSAGIGRRPDPTKGNVSQVESSALMRGHALSLTFRGRAGRRLSLMAQYTLASTKDDSRGLFALSADNYNLRPEWGRADFDQRRRFTLAGTFDLPGGFRLGSFVNLASSLPYDITTGFDDNGDTVANDRPAGVTRNTGRGPGFARVDLRVSRAFKVPRLLDRRRERSSRNLEFSVDFFNLFNRVNYENYVGAQSSPFFGRAVAAHQARTMQFSARYKF